MKRFYGIIVCLVFSMSVIAQAPDMQQHSAATRRPDLQTADGAFFDPTRVVKTKPVYHFSTQWRIEAGYVQNYLHSRNKTFSNNYLHGGQIGFRVDFMLPYNLSLQTGLSYALTYGKRTQRWGTLQDANDGTMNEYNLLTTTEHTLLIPVRAWYKVDLPKRWRLLFYGGPQLQIGLTEPVKVQSHLSPKTQAWLNKSGIRYEDYDNYRDGILNRANIQLGVGGGVEWDRLRLTAGYDFGLNNLVKNQQVDKQHAWEWSWFVSFGVRLNNEKKDN